MALLLTRDCSSDDEHRDCSQPGWYCSRKSFSMPKACEHATRLLTRLVTSTKTRDFKRDVSFVYILCIVPRKPGLSDQTFPQNVWPARLVPNIKMGGLEVLGWNNIFCLALLGFEPIIGLQTQEL